jgi:HK97 family phage prohead protease
VITGYQQTFERLICALLRTGTLSEAEIRPIAGPVATRWEPQRAASPPPRPADLPKPLVRQVGSTTLEYRTVVLSDGSNGPGLSGYAATFWEVDSYGTALVPGAFSTTLKDRGHKIPLLWQHDPQKAIGRNTGLREDATGLRFDAQVVTETAAGAEAMALLRAGVPLGMSFGFETVRKRDYDPKVDEDQLTFTYTPETYRKNPEWVTVIEEVRLWESSIVTFAANEAAVIDALRQPRTLAAD